jgi:hypothetical protein
MQKGLHAEETLLATVQVHEGLVSDCCWSSRSSTCPAPTAIGPVSSKDGSSASRRELSLISCSYDGTLSVLQASWAGACMPVRDMLQFSLAAVHGHCGTQM